MTPQGQQLFAGLDIGGTKIAAVVANRRGHILASGVISSEPPGGPESACRRAADLLRELEDQCASKFLALGVGAPGLVDSSSGKTVLLPNLPREWQDFNIVEAFVGYLGRPAYLMNDARLATLGEYTFGTQPPVVDMLFVTVGTGVGGGLVLDGKLRTGAYGAAGELGHHTIIPDGAQCGCGSRGCLETLISGPALSAAGWALVESDRAPILTELTKKNNGRVTPLLMVEAANEGDFEVANAINRAATYLGIGIANAISITAVQEVVVGGGLVVLGDHLLGPVRKVVRERVRMFPSASIRVRCSTLGVNVGALGGVALAIQQYSRCLSTAPSPFMESFQ